MKSRVNLVAILLTLSYMLRTLEGLRDEKHGNQKEYPVGKKVIKEVHSKVAAQSAVLLRRQDKTKVAKTRIKNTGLGLSKDYLHESDRPRRRKRKMDRTMMALLMAYKLKFVALIPTMVGGLILLKATALLAGFFFALFAAVLGLKAH